MLNSSRDATRNAQPRNPPRRDLPLRQVLKRGAEITRRGQNNVRNCAATSRKLVMLVNGLGNCRKLARGTWGDSINPRKTAKIVCALSTECGETWWNSGEKNTLVHFGAYPDLKTSPVLSSAIKASSFVRVFVDWSRGSLFHRCARQTRLNILILEEVLTMHLTCSDSRWPGMEISKSINNKFITNVTHGILLVVCRQRCRDRIVVHIFIFHFQDNLELPSRYILKKKGKKNSYRGNCIWKPFKNLMSVHLRRFCAHGIASKPHFRICGFRIVWSHLKGVS